MALSPALTSASNAVAKALDFGVAEIDVRHAKERSDRLLRRVAEVGSDDVGKNVFARRLGRLRWIIDVARTVFGPPGETR